MNKYSIAFRSMYAFVILLVYTGLSLLILTTYSCTPTIPSGPPPAVQACAILGSKAYNCQTNSPGNLVIDGKGAIRLSVVSDPSPQFIQVVNYLPNNYSSPTVTLQNSTNSSGTHQVISSGASQSEVHFDIPQSDAFTLKAWYIEYGYNVPDYNTTGNTVTTCSNPDTYGCYRWYKMISLADGTDVSCQSNYIIFIDKEDPSGIVGNCTIM